MEHPDPECRKNQAEFLAQCSPEQKALHGALFRTGNAAVIYHQIASETSDSLKKEYYPELLEGLLPNIRKSMEQKGFEGCKNSYPFTRYVNERNDIWLDEWLKAHV